MLPDEIVKEILAPVLQVSDEAFCDISRASPFFRNAESTSALLVVCKSWLRVSTPLLYSVVVLRSKAQAQALERALRGNKLLGTFIRKLRVEGGFGSAMYQIIQCAPNVTDLWLMLNIFASDSVSGLRRGLPQMDPRHVILYMPTKDRDNAPCRQLTEILATCIKTWKNMEILNLPYSDRQIVYSYKRDLKICEATNLAPNLKTLILKHPQTSKSLRIMTKNPSLQIVRVVLDPSGPSYEAQHSIETSKYHERQLQEDASMRQIVQFEYPEPEPETPLPASPVLTSCLPLTWGSFVALQATSSAIKEKIFSVIIYFSLIIDVNEVARTSSRPTRRRGNSTFAVEHTNKIARANILLVSKLFRKLALQHLYRHSIIETFLHLKVLTDYIEEDPSLGANIYSIIIDPVTYLEGDVASNNLRTILSHSSCLKSLSGPSALQSVMYPLPVLGYDGLKTLAYTAGTTMLTLGQGLVIGESLFTVSAAPLYAFTSLRSLEWNGLMSLDFERAEVPPCALASLESLAFSGQGSFLALLGCMKLPALRHVTFLNPGRMEGAREFLQVHGEKLETLKVDTGGHWTSLCPALSILHFSEDPSFEPHANLTKIVLTKHVRLVRNRDNIKVAFEDLGSVDFGGIYPALKEVQVYSCEWPTTEHEISSGFKSNWVKWSERLAKWSIKLTDREGRHWRPRLK